MLLDGAHTEGLGSSGAIFGGYANAPIDAVLGGFRVLHKTTVSAGSRSFCLGLFTSAGTLVSNSASESSFGVVRVK